MKGTCKDCHWAMTSHRGSSAGTFTVLECCFNPPAPVDMVRDGGHVSALRPEVYADDFCVQWTPKVKSQKMNVKEGKCNRE